MAYIDKEAFKRKLIDEKNFFPAIVARALKEMPAADVVEVVRCKECKYTDTVTCPITGTKTLFCEYGVKPIAIEPTHFCSYGERRSE